MTVIGIVQARMGSTRLPGKVMLDLAGDPMLVRCMRRIQRCKTITKVVVATTIHSADDRIVQLSNEYGWDCYRGSEDDVLDRYYKAAMAHSADVVVRITSDCPMIDTAIVDRVVKEFMERRQELDYACNFLPKRTFPRGLDTEVMHFETLERVWRADNDPASREHVTPYIYRNPSRFRIHGIMGESDQSSLRWTVDTAEDLVFVRLIYEHFGHDHFSSQEVLDVLADHTEWSDLNCSVRQKSI